VELLLDCKPLRRLHSPEGVDRREDRRNDDQRPERDRKYRFARAIAKLVAAPRLAVVGHLAVDEYHQKKR
jgi:hypothetical protein